MAATLAYSIARSRFVAISPRYRGADAQSRSRDAICIRVISKRYESFASNGREAFFFASLKTREAERRTAHLRYPHLKEMRARSFATARLSALLRGYTLRSFNPNSAWAALPGIAGCKREDPLRRQCSRHPAVRSRAGRDDAQTACKQERRTPLTGTAPAPSVASPVDVPHNERDAICYSNRASVVKEFIPRTTCADKSGVSAQGLFMR
jgi:hypothetical protein